MNIVNVILRAISSILFLSLFAANQSSAQPTFIQHTIYETIYTSSIYFGHFDDDGDIDLATTTPISDRQGNPYGDAVFWWENDGLQNFTSHAITNNFPHARFVYISDMDMDGDSDILAGAETTNGIRWWENSGNYPPIFEEHVIGFGYRRAHAVLASDLDGDDDIDVVGIGNDAIDLVWFENDGVMDFTEHTIDTSVFVIQDMEIVDFNDNGNNDIITVAQYPYEKVSIFINTGGQPIEFEEIIVSRDIFRTIQHIDLDRDSDIDLICAGYDSGIKWFENTGNFTFVEHSIDRYMWRAGTGRSLKAIDVDCDGDIDFVDGVGDGFSNNGIGYIRWWENDGFQDFTIRIVNDQIDSPQAINAIDIDEDGDIDIFTGARGGPFVWWENELDPVADASIDGTITVEGTGEVVEGAEVIFGKFSDITDENGHYEIDTAYSLPYTVLIRTEGFESYVEPDYDIEQGENRCDFEISPAETTPTQFSLISPDSNSFFTTEYNQLTWQSSTESDYGDSVVYDVYVQRSQIDSFFNPRITGLTDTFYTFQARGDSTWYWTVHARDTNSEGTWAGEVWSFVTFNVVSVEEEVSGIPHEYSIVSLHPNPFNSTIQIVVGIPFESKILAEVYNILGRQVATVFSGNIRPGYHKITWMPEGTAGIYFLNISSGSGWNETRKLLYLK